MNDEDKTINELMQEAKKLRKRVAQLELAQKELTKSNKDLLERARQFGDIFQFGLVGMFHTTPQGKFIRVNDRLAEMLGYESAEELKAGVDNIAEDLYMVPSQREEIIRLLEESDEVLNFEIGMRRRDSSMMTANLSVRSVRDETGRLLYLEGFLDDITEQNRLVDSLARQTQDLAKRVKELNCLFEISNFIEEKDISLDDIIQGIVEFLPLAWQYTEITCARAVLEDQEFRTDNFSETRWQLASDIKVNRKKVGSLEVFYLEDRPQRDEGPFLSEERSLINTVAERLGGIVKRKRAEEDLLQSEERFRAIFESARDCIFVKDQNFIYTHVNPAMERLFRRPAAEIIGRSAENLFHEQDLKRVQEVDLRVLYGKTVEEEVTREIGGVPFTFHEIRAPLRNARGLIVGVCGISRDVTERKRAVPFPPVSEAYYRSESMRSTLAKAHQAATKSGIVLLQGETGTGKDYLARWIHDHSRRASGSFFVLNCAAVSHELAESELFGHERGAFTGAGSRKRGLLELAEGGTLLLNEIGELPLTLQSKLLTFLDSKTFLRVGGDKAVQIDARIIAATHRDLRNEVTEGRFLEPLLYRLDVFSITVPPLRDRTEDIPALAEEIIAKAAIEMQISEVPLLGPSQIADLERYHWPGNVRELRNVLERTLMVWDGESFNLDLPLGDALRTDISHELASTSGWTLQDILDEVTRSVCLDALQRSRGKRQVAAKNLGISRTSFYRLLKRHGIDDDSVTDS